MNSACVPIENTSTLSRTVKSNWLNKFLSNTTQKIKSLLNLDPSKKLLHTILAKIRKNTPDVNYKKCLRVGMAIWATWVITNSSNSETLVSSDWLPNQIDSQYSEISTTSPKWITITNYQERKQAQLGAILANISASNLETLNTQSNWQKLAQYIYTLTSNNSSFVQQSFDWQNKCVANILENILLRSSKQAHTFDQAALNDLVATFLEGNLNRIEYIDKIKLAGTINLDRLAPILSENNNNSSTNTLPVNESKVQKTIASVITPPLVYPLSDRQVLMSDQNLSQPKLVTLNTPQIKEVSASATDWVGEIPTQVKYQSDDQDEHKNWLSWLALVWWLGGSTLIWSSRFSAKSKLKSKRKKSEQSLNKQIVPLEKDNTDEFDPEDCSSIILQWGWTLSSNLITLNNDSFKKEEVLNVWEEVEWEERHSDYICKGIQISSSLEERIEQKKRKRNMEIKRKEIRKEMLDKQIPNRNKYLTSLPDFIQTIKKDKQWLVIWNIIEKSLKHALNTGNRHSFENACNQLDFYYSTGNMPRKEQINKHYITNMLTCYLLKEMISEHIIEREKRKRKEIKISCNQVLSKEMI